MCVLYVCLGYLALLLKSTDEKGTALAINCLPLGFCCVHVNEASLSEPHINELYGIQEKHSGSSKLSHKQ